MGLLQLCEKYFNSSNLYEILGISEKATEKEVKKAYHKLSLKVHPDRVEEDEKIEATEKFKVLGAIHAILSDANKRSVYDETKTVDEEDNCLNDDHDWTAYWRLVFKKITVDDIKKYEKEYIGSQEERHDLKTAYLAKKGDMDYIIDNVQFASSEQEPRLREILNEMIESGEIPVYKKFTNETDKKKQKRKAKENREAKEAEEWKRDLGLEGSSSLELMIKQRQEARGDQIIDYLATKYCSGTSGTKRKRVSKTESMPKTKKKKK